MLKCEKGKEVQILQADFGENECETPSWEWGLLLCYYIPTPAPHLDIYLNIFTLSKYFYNWNIVWVSLLTWQSLTRELNICWDLCFGSLIYIFLKWYLCSSSTSSHSQCFFPGEKTKILLLPKLLKSLVLPPTLSCTLRCMRGHKDVSTALHYL